MDSIKSDVKVLTSENTKLSKDIVVYKLKDSELKRNNKLLSDKITTCESKIDYLLNKERANNFILFKVKDSAEQNVNLLETVKLIFHKAEINIHESVITNVRRLGNQKVSRPNLVCFNDKIICILSKEIFSQMT